VLLSPLLRLPDLGVHALVLGSDRPLAARARVVGRRGSRQEQRENGKDQGSEAVGIRASHGSSIGQFGGFR
jgi:hypothetical protein